MKINGVLLVALISALVVALVVVFMNLERRQKYCYLKSSPHEASNMWLVTYTPGVEGSCCRPHYKRLHKPSYRQIGGVRNSRY